MTNLRERLIFAMNLANIRQVDLAKSLRISRTSVNDWVSGKSKNIRGDNLIKIANILNINPNWLATGFGKFDSNWPFENVKAEDINLLPEEVLSFVEDVILMQIEKYRNKQS